MMQKSKELQIINPHLDLTQGITSNFNDLLLNELQQKLKTLQAELKRLLIKDPRA